MIIPEAPVVWGALKGLVCVYKPAEVSVKKLRTILINKVCQGKHKHTYILEAISCINVNKMSMNYLDMNTLEVRPPIAHVAIEGSSSRQLTVSVKPSLADHPLVVGPRYQEQDLPVSWSNYLGFNTSGVLCKSLILQ